MRIFIVDDEAIAISRLEYLLKNFENVEVIGSARKIEESVNRIIRLKPDLVFIDIEIGNGTGFEIIQKVDQIGFRPRYIVVTAHCQYAMTGIRNRVDDFILKPIDFMDLKSSIERISRLRTVNFNQLAVDLLTNRERQVLTYLLNGKTSRQIAFEMNLSRHTIDAFRRKILKKLGADKTTELFTRFINPASASFIGALDRKEQ